MKLSEVVLLEPIPALGTSSYKTGPHFDVSFEAGFVSIVRLERATDEEPWMVPVHNVRFMRPAKGEAKKK